MQIIPLQAVPSQTFTAPLGGQRCQISVYQKTAFPHLIATVGQDAINENNAYLRYPQRQNIRIGTTTGPALVLTPRIYVDLSVNDQVVLTGVPGLAGVPIVRDAYLGFAGDLCFYDSQGLDDPVYTGFGSRWFLAYITAIDQATP